MSPGADHLPPDLPPLSDATARQLGRVVDVIDRCAELSNQLEGQFREALEACHAHCSSLDTDCLACISGRVQSILNAANDIGVQCQVKLRAKIIDLTGNAMQKAVSVFQYEPPDTAQAAANLAAGIYPTVGPLAVQLTAPPIGTLPPPEPIATIPPVVILPPPEPIILGEPPPFTLGEPPPLPEPAPAPGMCPAPIINIPPCPAPGPGGMGIPGPPGPAGPPGLIVLPPGVSPPAGWPSSWFIETIVLPDNTITLNMPPLPPPVVNLTVDYTPLPPGAPPPVVIEGDAQAKPAPDKAGSWNAVKCPVVGANLPEGYDGNWFHYMEKASGFSITVNAAGEKLLNAPDGFWGRPKGSKATTGEIIRWFSAYGIAVALPAIGATLIPPGGACNVNASIADYATILLIEFVERWVGVDLVNLKQPSKYDINYNCPSFLPGQGEVDQLFQARWIDKDLWKCWTRANNQLDIPRELAVEASRPRITPEQAFSLEKRFPNLYKNWFIDEVRKHGWAENMVGTVERLQEYIPSASDLVRFMVRDVFDETVYKPFQLDLEFPQKFDGDVKKWAESQGMSDEKMLLYWRAHWQWPSPSQMYQMLHRWRPDAPGRPAGVEPVDITMVERVLGINDVAPTWRKRLAYLSYKVVNRLELRRLYANDLISEKGFIDGMQDLGYELRAATYIKDLFKKLNEDNAEKKARTLSIATIQGWYVDGAISRAQAEDRLQRYRLDEGAVYRILADADFKAEAVQRKNVIGNVKRRYAKGEFLADRAIGTLVAAGVEVVRAVQLVRSWDQHISTKGKHASAAQLCKWLGQNLLTQEEYLNRLINMGWDRIDAERIVASCELDIVKKATPKPPKPKPPKGK